MHAEQNTFDEEALIAAARSGDERAFARLVERYQAPVFAAIVAISRDFAGAQDLAQEVFLRAWFGLGDLQSAASFPGWLQTIARNRARSHLAWRQRQPPREELPLDLADAADPPDRRVEKAERRRLVLAALEALPEDSRQVLLLHYMEELSTPKIAQRLGISEAAVRQRLRRARRQMQEKAEDIMADVIREEAPGVGFSETVTSLLERARALFRQVHYHQAAPLLEQARELAPDDTLISLLLADAYTFTRSPADLEADRGAYDRALALLDEVVEREPENMLARLRRAAVRAILAPEEELFAEQRRIREAARGGPYEAVAELELARRHLTRGQGKQALTLYEGLEKKCPWLAGVLYSEMGVAHALSENGDRAIACFERAVEQTTPQAMAELEETSKRLIGEAYWVYWSTVDNLAARQCQNHAWLAGLYSVGGRMAKARQHLRQALRYLDSDELGEAAAVLKRQFATQMEQMFPVLAAEPEVQALRQQIEAS
ncbi:MAG: hypothetical protein QG573_1340 [Acidobacteriota bacterium]|nr:hypothetical protein [Acidobacteriota bacterium]